MTVKTPADFLKMTIGEQVLVKLNTGMIFRGKLICLDGYMNIALENTEEVDENGTVSYGDAFIRGNNVQFISALSS